MPNQLHHELSPYLLQHAENPVDWRPWGAEALALARTEQKPIFLSIGYASCHWCHVMAHESFEDSAIARLLNDHFVCMKVDREERFDLDQIYMEAVQMMTGRGGWPLSVFLTPDGEPFFGGTYWPPRARDGISGFDEVLLALADAWQHRHSDVLEQAHKITQLLRQAEMPATPVELDDTMPQEAEAILRRSFNPQWGGFGPAPKFPQPLALRWLLHRWRRSGDDELLKMATTTLDHMAAGGMFDHLGGGFHRYCVDDRWQVPHFEKMLYDNAMLAVCYLESWQATGKEEYAIVVRRTLDYLLRDMTDPQGGFYSGEDADSEGQEGKFYLWSPGEIVAVLGPETGRLFCRIYNVTDAGNFEGRNILSLLRPLEVEARLFDYEPALLAAKMDAARAKLLAARAKRVRPGCDEKVLVGWNSLAVDALAQAGAALGEPRYTAAANRAVDFLWNHLHRDDGRLLHYWRKGQAKCDTCLDDYAGLGNALLTLYETGGPPARLDQTVAVADEILARFADPEHGGFYYTANDHEPLIVRKMDCLDNPTPSGNGLAATLLLRLQTISGNNSYRAAAEAAIRACLALVRQAPTGAFQLLLTMDLLLSSNPENEAQSQ
ncbi:MAG: thioredoxin domain-containing protein [Pirellulales bacterium]|nr:thioredoxin domain-containing protein [Pirellulales bacterium]